MPLHTTFFRCRDFYFMVESDKSTEQQKKRKIYEQTEY